MRRQLSRVASTSRRPGVWISIRAQSQLSTMKGRDGRMQNRAPYMSEMTSRASNQTVLMFAQASHGRRDMARDVKVSRDEPAGCAARTQIWSRELRLAARATRPPEPG